MTRIIEFPSRRPAPRLFVEPPADLGRRIARALDALGNLPDEFASLPGLAEIADALIKIADDLEGDADLEPDDDGD
ncbi:hypothetical protein [Methylosinus sp. Ce-a6]|uniref:hypothetical protein n=1 Tax=Methylosinus sp. Ce-a6 TaxID=2172005 RepID=UPI00135977FC|nr:hypothetical protein [Methylosinus sp. Ce-a6]